MEPIFDARVSALRSGCSAVETSIETGLVGRRVHLFCDLCYCTRFVNLSSLLKLLLSDLFPSHVAFECVCARSKCVCNTGFVNASTARCTGQEWASLLAVSPFNYLIRPKEKLSRVHRFKGSNVFCSRSSIVQLNVKRIPVPRIYLHVRIHSLAQPLVPCL